MITPKYQSHPWALVRRHSPHARHKLTIVLQGNDGSRWETTLNLSTETSSPQFLILELPAPVSESGGAMRQLTNVQSEFIVPLAGVAAASNWHDLSKKALNEWMTTMLDMFERGPTVTVLVSQGRISLTLHPGGLQ